MKMNKEGINKTLNASEMSKEKFPRLYCSEDALPLKSSHFYGNLRSGRSRQDVIIVQ